MTTERGSPAFGGALAPGESEERMEATPAYSEMVGARLRSIRKQRGLSLQDVQRLSGGEFKAAVVGAYERGERSLSLPRLRRLAAFFQVPMGQFLPSRSPARRPSRLCPTAGSPST